MNTIGKLPLTIACAECQVGQMHRHYVTYFTWLGDELITVPDFPSWVCDLCGRRDYDPGALNQLSLLLSPNAGKATNRKPIKPRGVDHSKPQPRQP